MKEAIDILGDKFNFACDTLTTTVKELRSDYRGDEIVVKRAAIAYFLLGDNPKREDIPRVMGLLHRDRTNWHRIVRDDYIDVKRMKKNLIDAYNTSNSV